MQQVEELYLCPFDWSANEEDEKIVVYAWCLDPKSKPALLRITGVKDYLVVELPNKNNGNIIRWDNTKVSNFIKALSTCLNRGDEDHAPINAVPTRRKKLFYYGNDDYRFVYLYFNNQDAIRHCKNLLYKRDVDKKFEVPGLGKLSFKIWEDDINVVRKLLTQKSIKHSDWLCTNARLVPENQRVSTLDMEYTCDYNLLKSVPYNITHNFRITPKIVAIDYEVNSENIYKFPNKKLIDDVIFMVSLVYQEYTRPETRKIYMVLLGDCQEIPGLNIIRVKTEMELLDVKDRLIKELDPDIIIGHNTYGFDFPYEYMRRHIMGLEMKNTSRLRDGKNTIKSLDWNSDGAGYNKGSMIISPGRIYLDLLKIIKRNNNKMRNYNLNSCAMRYLGKSKHDVSPQEMFLAYQYQRDHRDNISQESLQQMTKIVNYCANDSELVIELGETLKLWNDVSEMSNAAGVPIIEVYSQGMQRRSISRIYNEAYSQGVVLSRRNRVSEHYKGAHVLTPIPGIDDYVATYDFSSLYPNLIRAFNLCYRTLIPIEANDTFNDDLVNVIRINEGERQYIYKFYKNKDIETILPKICTDLIESRKQAKRKMAEAEQAGDKMAKTIFDSKQNALKITVNSVYGFLGVSTSEYSAFEIARSVTAKGREMILLVNRIISEKFGYRVVYNDTDSVMYVVPGCSNYQEACDVAKQVLQYINSVLPQPLTMVLEKIGRMLRLARKKYIYWYWDMDKRQMEMDKQGNPSLHVTGVTTARRDNCAFQTRLYDKLSKHIMVNGSIQEAYDSILEVVIALMTRCYGVNELYTVRELKGNYKSENTMMRLLAKRLKDIGRAPEPGERLEFVIAKLGKQYIGENIVLVDEYKESLGTDTPYKIDYLAYVEKYLCNCIDQLFGVGYQRELEILERQYLEKDVNNLINGIYGNYPAYRQYISDLCDNEPTVGAVLQKMSQNKKIERVYKRYYSHYIQHRGRIMTRITATPVANLVNYLKIKDKCLKQLLDKFN